MEQGSHPLAPGAGGGGALPPVRRLLPDVSLSTTVHGVLASTRYRVIVAPLDGAAVTVVLSRGRRTPWGDWLYHCHVTDHMAGGMIGWYRVADT